MHRTNVATGGRVDYWGAAFLVVAFVPLLLALTWGGNKFAWASPTILALFVTSTCGLIAFVFMESRVPDPIMPLSLLRNRAYAITNFAAFIISMAFFGVVMFMPLYMQLVLGVNATKSGFAMLPLMLGIMSTAVISGRLVRRTGRYKPIMIAGCVLLFVGVVLLMQIGPDTTIKQLNWRMLLVGLGLGPVQSLYSLAAQNAAPMNQLGIATSGSQFFRQIGSTVGIAIFGTVLTHNLMQELPKRLPQVPGLSAEKIDLGHMQARAMSPNNLRDEIDHAVGTQYELIERAYRGDAAAAADVMRNPQVPEAIKQRLRSPPDEATINQDLARIKQALSAYAAQLATKFERAIKVGFSSAIVSMLQSALWIVGLGLLITLFVPVLALRSHGPTTAASPAQSDPQAKAS
jgi:MFS family permease